MDVTGDRSKVSFCKEQYCIGTWNIRSMNQGKLEVIKQEMAREFCQENALVITNTLFQQHKKRLYTWT